MSGTTAVYASTKHPSRVHPPFIEAIMFPSRWWFEVW